MVTTWDLKHKFEIYILLLITPPVVTNKELIFVQNMFSIDKKTFYEIAK
jgi:hypothetical protein